MALLPLPTAFAQGEGPQPGFSLTGPGGTTSSLTIEQGETGSVVFTITPSGGFTGIVTNTAGITSTPANSRMIPWVDFGSSSQVHITGPQPATAILKIYGDGRTHLSSLGQKGLPWYAPGGSALACAALLFSRRRRLTGLAGMALLAVMSGSMMACGNPWIPVTRGDYVITVTSYSTALPFVSCENTVRLTVK